MVGLCATPPPGGRPSASPLPESTRGKTRGSRHGKKRRGPARRQRGLPARRRGPGDGRPAHREGRGGKVLPESRRPQDEGQELHQHRGLRGGQRDPRDRRGDLPAVRGGRPNGCRTTRTGGSRRRGRATATSSITSSPTRTASACSTWRSSTRGGRRSWNRSGAWPACRTEPAGPARLPR